MFSIKRRKSRKPTNNYFSVCDGLGVLRQWHFNDQSLEDTERAFGHALAYLELIKIEAKASPVVSEINRFRLVVWRKLPSHDEAYAEVGYTCEP